MQNARLDESQAGIKISTRNIINRSLKGDKNVLKLDSGDGCIITLIYLRPYIVYLKRMSSMEYEFYLSKLLQKTKQNLFQK